jgi:hypothetical protein
VIGLVSLLSLVSLVMRLDARRPASWIAAAAGFVALVGILSRPTPVWVAAACGGLLGVAALGFPTRLTAVPGLVVPRAVARVAWPMLGIAAAALGSGRIAAAVPHAAIAAAAALLGMAATLGSVLPAAGRWRRRLAFVSLEDGSLTAWLDAAAMISVLAAMAVCYFLAPQAAGWYAVVAGMWFVGFVVPRATLDGVDAEARRTLMATAAGLPRLPGTPRHAARVLATGAATLGWPAMVAGLLWAGPAWAASGPAAAVVLLAVLAGISGAAACLQRVPDDTPLALAACTLGTFLAWFAQAL